MNEKMVKRPVVHGTVEDGEAVGTKLQKGVSVKKHKTYPNGIQVTFGALWQYWWEYGDLKVARKSDTPETTAEEFGEIFDLVAKAEELQRKYRDIKPPRTALKAGEAFQEVGNASRVGLDYFTIRWASEIVDLPVGLFILFTHFISRERRLSNRVKKNELSKQEMRDGLVNLIEQIESFSQKAREIIDRAPDSEGIFFEEFPKSTIKQSKKNKLRDNEAAYLARLSVLKELVDAAGQAKKKI